MAVQSEAIVLFKADRPKISDLFSQPRSTDLDLAALGRRLAARKQAQLAEGGSIGFPMTEARSFTSHLSEQDPPRYEPADMSAATLLVQDGEGLGCQ